MANTKIPSELSSTPSISDNGDATAITIDSSELIGINTASPQKKLHILGQDGSTGLTEGNSRTQLFLENNQACYINIASANNNKGAIFFSDADANNQGAIRYNHNGDNLTFDTANTERLWIDSSGVIYFGPNGSTADPRINRHSNGYDYINSGDSRWLKIGASSGHTNVAFQDGSSGITIFETAGTERMRITSDGKIGISESVPTGKLHIRDNNFSGYIGVFSQGGTGGANHGMFIETGSGSSYLMIQRVSGSTKHYVIGDGNYYFAGSHQSDLNKKENIADISNGLNVVNNLRPRTFNYKDNSTIDKAGFIAQEAQIVEPSLVTGNEFDETQTDDEGLNPTGLGFDYMGYTAYLTKAIQEQQTIIEDLKSRIETLEG